MHHQQSDSQSILDNFAALPGNWISQPQPVNTESPGPQGNPGWTLKGVERQKPTRQNLGPWLKVLLVGG